MLTTLRIENFAIIDHLELEFGPGLVTLTGETGAGKSIILDAIMALLGAKLDGAALRSGAERALVEGVFSLPPETRAEVQAILQREDLLDDPDSVTLGREVRREGRTTARVNGRSVGAGLLRELGEYLVDIHGQSEHLSLLNVRQHLGLLDRFAGSEKLLAAYRKTYQSLQKVRRDLAELRQMENDSARMAEILAFQAEEIEAAQLQPGEEAALRLERDRLANAEHLAGLTQQGLSILDEGSPETPSVSDLLGQVSQALHALSRIDSSQSKTSEQAETLLELCGDLALALRAYQEQVEYNPRRLEVVEDRLDLLRRLLKKYGGSVEAAQKYAAEARGKLEAITHAGERIEQLEKEESALLARLAEEGQKMSELRRKASEKLERGVEAELADLSMQGARFQAAFRVEEDPAGLLLADGRRAAFDASGFDRLEFLIAPNPGEGFKPLVKTASGGETSRLMLALKNVLSRADCIPTLVFDEIDQGIGGRVGMVVGHKLWNLARRHQVLCVTHLPQLAAFGEQHLGVRKQLEDGRTATRVEVLQDDARLDELAQMLGAVTEANRQAARETLEAARKAAA